MSGAANANGDKVYDIATGYYIKAVKEPAATAGRLQIAVYLYSPTGEVVDKFVGTSFPEGDADKYNFVGIDIVPYSATAVTYYLWTETISQYSRSITYAQQNSATLKQYFSGEQGYAINADYAVIDVQPYSITDNGTYTAPFSKAYSPVTVDVQEQPWTPLQDGYSNFWFELTNDTLSPWLNFSAKNNDAVIDWGDGSGEVALDTLTPTHTYSKAGKYVVKVKGVTGLARQHPGNLPYTPYVYVLTNVELASEVTATSEGAFYGCVGIKNAVAYGNIQGVLYWFVYCGALRYADFSNTTNIVGSAFYHCHALETVKIDSAETIGSNAFNLDINIRSITIPSTITFIGQAAFAYCFSLSEVHCQATTPPTLGNNVFTGLPSDWLCYVPVGTGETYKAAAGWSTYADHILEEGQTPNRAMLSRLAKAAKAAAKAAAEAEDK